jgi:tetratricopeptide (TPR) repeat protein
MVLLSLGLTQGQTASREYFRAAKFRYDKKDYKNALDHINNAIADDSTNLSAWLLRADINYALGYHHGTIRDIHQSFKLDENQGKFLGEYHLLLAKALARTGSYDQAFEELEHALDLIHSNADLYFERALLYKRRGQHREALKDLDVAINIKPDNAVYYANRARIRYDRYRPLPGTQSYETALADINVAIALEPDNYEYHQLRTQMVRNDERTDEDELLEEYSQMILQFPNEPDAYKQRGIMLMNNYNYQEAISDFNATLQLDNNDRDSYRYRALCFHNLHQYDRAIADFTHAIDHLQSMISDSENSKQIEFVLSETYFLRGNTYLMTKKNTESCADFLRAYNLGSKKGLNYYRKYCNVY